jgi:nitroimidazol reductase NimA-like FMN-containing flavoprotein (pyridoxamine 5'-phosphate oxidase superfamily)
VKWIDSRTGIERLDRDECLRLLAGEEVGRVAFVRHGVPEIFPVNYALGGEAVVFRTDPGTKLDAERRGPAAFEIDQFDRVARSGWSVVALGRLEEVTARESEAYQRVRALDIHPWAEGEKAHWLRLVPSTLSGRRVTPPQDIGR